ncbi:MAG TPA: type II toxin-antitoxin system mRNA interferase toxin, RelE/StbE family [Nitrospiraceae bacterium]|nr:type II toxin-antitoxin system mRNA interferase toxin, RelE/StbE family [Nitrospiraceae bacterium]
MRIRWASKAERQLDDIENYIARDNPAAATRVIIDIIESARQLIQFPKSGRPGKKKGTRELVLVGTPYILVYRTKGDEIQILSVFHSSMKVG